MQMKDTYGDIVEVEAQPLQGNVYLIVEDSDIADAPVEAQVELTPKMARKLAIALLRAAEKVEAQR